MGDVLKSVWRLAPQSARLLFCGMLCGMFAGRRPEDQGLAEADIVCGAFSSASGLGRGARLYADRLERSGRRVVRVDAGAAMRMPPNLSPDLSQDLQPDLPPASEREAGGIMRPVRSIRSIRAMRGAQGHGGGRVIIHANPPQFQLVLCALGRRFLRGRRVVGYWAWELEEFPGIWKQALDYVDEVEVPSAFVADALRRLTRRPVSVRPHPLPEPARRKTEFARGGIVRVLNVFDAGSCWERKNPEAALRAFAKAFRPGEAEMSFKISNTANEPQRLAEFWKLCAATPGVKIITGALCAAEMEELYLGHDIYLSLHRSEGFGLPIAEAMNYGLHAVATGWSGNMDFMTGELAHAVPYELVPVEFDRGPCKGMKARWAGADTDAAAEILRGIAGRMRRKRDSGLCGLEQVSIKTAQATAKKREPAQNEPEKHVFQAK